MAKISDEVKTWFLGDSSGLVNAANKANAALDSNAKAEAKAALAARRAADSRAESFRTALVKPALELQRTTGILNSGLKLTTLAGGLALAAGKFNELRDEALGARKEMEEFGERYRQFSQANKRPTGAEDATSLMGKLTEAHGLETTLKDRRLALHPEPGFERWRMMNQYNAGFPGHGVEEWQKDINTNKAQIQDNDRTQLNLRQAIDQSFRNEVDLTKKQLQGSSQQLRIKELELARTREIRALEGTDANTSANKSAINERLDLQIAKEKEMQTLRDRQFDRDSQSLGISRQLVSDEQRRVNLLQFEADGVNEQLRTRQFKSDEENQALVLRSLQLKNELVDAKAAAAMAESQFRLARQTVDIQRTNTSTVVQRYRVEQATLTTLREQYAAVEKVNESRARGLKLTLERQADALTNSQGRAKLGEQRQYSHELVRQMKGQISKGFKPGSLDGGILGLSGKIAAANDIGSSRTAATAMVKLAADQLTAQSVTNNLLGRVVDGLSNLVFA